MKKSDIRVGDVRLLPRKVAAAKVGVCERTLFQWCEDGIGLEALQHLRFNNRYRS